MHRRLPSRTDRGGGAAGCDQLASRLPRVSRITQDRRSPTSKGYATSEGYAGRRVGLQHRLDKEPGDPRADRDGCRAFAPSRPPPDIAGEAYGFLLGTAHIGLAAGPTPAFPLLLGPRGFGGQRPPAARCPGSGAGSRGFEGGRSIPSPERNVQHTWAGSRA